MWIGVGGEGWGWGVWEPRDCLLGFLQPNTNWLWCIGYRDLLILTTIILYFFGFWGSSWCFHILVQIVATMCNAKGAHYVSKFEQSKGKSSVTECESAFAATCWTAAAMNFNLVPLVKYLQLQSVRYIQCIWTLCIWQCIWTTDAMQFNLLSTRKVLAVAVSEEL